MRQHVKDSRRGGKHTWREMAHAKTRKGKRETRQEKESTAEEMKKIFTKKSQWKEFLKFVTNGFKIK